MPSLIEAYQERADHDSMEIAELRRDLDAERARRQRLLTILVGLRQMSREPRIIDEIDKILERERRE